VQGQQDALAPAQSRLDGVAEPDADFLVNDQAIHHGFDGVLFFRVQFDAHAVSQFHQFAVHAGADEAFTGEAFDHVTKFAFLPPDDGREQHDARPRRQGEDFVHNVGGGLAHDGDTGLRAVGLADVRIKESQVIVNLRCGGDDGAGAGAGAALLDGNGRGEAFDKVHVRLLHLVEELPGVGGERFDVLALALGVNGVEGQRRLARAAQAGDDHQLVARDVQREVLEVMLTRPADSYEFFAHRLDCHPLDNSAVLKATVGAQAQRRRDGVAVSTRMIGIRKSPSWWR
jgi:hypothetical protein